MLKPRAATGASKYVCKGESGDFSRELGRDLGDAWCGFSRVRNIT